MAAVAEEKKEDKPDAVTGTVWAGKEFYFYKTTDSTNMRAKQAAGQNASHGALFVADEQTLGRGRRGRAWQSPAGKNIYYTLLLRPELPADRASMLTLVMALSVAEGIGHILSGMNTGGGDISCRPGIKWPNDIVIDGRKVCGILTEMIPGRKLNTIQYVVIGAGINVAKQEFPEELMGKAVSLEEICGFFVSRRELLSDIMQSFENNYAVFMKCRDLAQLRERYNAFLVNRDRRVRVLDPKGEFEGVARGITDAGELLVETEDKSVRKVYAGEVSVRGIYGYV